MKGLAKLVKSIMISDEKARNSDYYLWSKVCKELCPKSLNYTFAFVLEHHNDLKIPNFESVGRARRKIQELYPDLRSTEEVQNEKDVREQMFREFAIEKYL